MKFDRAGKLLIEAVEELDELLMAMTCRALADDLALCDVQSGDKRGGAVALVIMGHCPGVPPKSEPLAMRDLVGVSG
jgi:hypothetical protein